MTVSHFYFLNTCQTNLHLCILCTLNKLFLTAGSCHQDCAVCRGRILLGCWSRVRFGTRATKVLQVEVSCLLLYIHTTKKIRLAALAQSIVTIGFSCLTGPPSQGTRVRIDMNMARGRDTGEPASFWGSPLKCSAIFQSNIALNNNWSTPPWVKITLSFAVSTTSNGGQLSSRSFRNAVALASSPI